MEGKMDWQNALTKKNAMFLQTEDGALVAAQFVKPVINKPTQGSDSAARIYEVEVYGLEEAL